MEQEQQRMVAERQRMEADRQRMELMFQWMQNLGASMGQSPPPELLAPLPPPEGTPVSKYLILLPLLCLYGLD